MSASEKLKALDVNLVIFDGGAHWIDLDGPQAGTAIFRLKGALPQIVAVVEAAEITWGTESPGGGGAYGAREGLAALAALDEALP